MIWKTLGYCQLDPCRWGGVVVMRNGTLVPVLTALDPVPEKLLRFMCCKCKILYKSLCSTNICSFQKHGLICVTACSDCNNTDCNNISLAQQEDDEWEDDVNLFECLL